LVAIATPMRPGGCTRSRGIPEADRFPRCERHERDRRCWHHRRIATVDVDEHWLLIKTAVEHAAGRIPVIAGTGANSTAEAIEHRRIRKKIGAHAGLSVVPYYNKPTQDGLYRHFRAIVEKSGFADAASITYRDGRRADLSTEPCCALRSYRGHRIEGRDFGHDSSGGASEAAAAGPGIRVVFRKRTTRRLRFMLLGGHGVISVTANVAPKLMSEMCAAAGRGDLATARAINEKLMSLHVKLFVKRIRSRSSGRCRRSD